MRVLPAQIQRTIDRRNGTQDRVTLTAAQADNMAAIGEFVGYDALRRMAQWSAFCRNLLGLHEDGVVWTERQVESLREMIKQEPHWNRQRGEG